MPGVKLALSTGAAAVALNAASPIAMQNEPSHARQSISYAVRVAQGHQPRKQSSSLLASSLNSATR